MLRIRYISKNRIEKMSQKSRIDFLLGFIKEKDIVIIDGRLKSRDEAELIRKTMDALHEDFEVFHGVEMASLNDNAPIKKSFIDIFKKPSSGITILGPAALIDEMKQHPDSIEFELKRIGSKRRIK